MVRDVLAIQASSIASEAAFSATGFQIGDHRHSLAKKVCKQQFYLETRLMPIGGIIIFQS